MRFGGTQFSDPAGPTTGDQQRRDWLRKSAWKAKSMVVSSRKIIGCFCLNP